MRPIVFLAAGAIALAAPLPVRAAEEGFQPLWNGKDLSGWKKVGGGATYRIEDGCIVGEVGPGPNTFLRTEKTYGDFILKLEARLDVPGNSGIQLRSHQRDGEGRVFGYQCEIDPSERAWTGGIYDEGRRGWLFPLSADESARKAYKAGEWNEFTLQAVGPQIRTWVNGVPCANLVDTADLEGFIALQVHSGKAGRIRWRNVRLKDLGRSEWKPLWDGKSLNGWEKIGGGDWKIVDGTLHGTAPKSEPRHGHLITKEQHGDFAVRVKYLAKQGNSGLYFRTEKRNDMVGVAGFQAEIDPENDAGGLYETSGRAWVVQPKPEDVKKWYKPGVWNEMSVVALGRRIVVHVNGHKTAELLDDPGRARGHIALQLHGGQDMDVAFKDVEILQLRSVAPPEGLKAATPGPASTQAGLPLVLHETFADGEKALSRFEFTDPKEWKMGKDGGRNVLQLVGGGKYMPAVRSPFRIAWIKDLKVGPFVMEAKVRSTIKDYGHRDLCLFFGGTDPSHFFYVHLGKEADPHAHSIFLVNGAPRVSVAKTRTAGTPWTEGYHTVRVVRNAAGETEVFWDGQSVMKADDRNFPSGRLGVGSFDDTGNFAEITVWGKKVN